MYKIIKTLFIFLVMIGLAQAEYTWTNAQDNLPGKSCSWQSIASSSDGSKLAAVVNSGYIYTSTDGGTTWTEQINAGQRYWISITSSSDGSKLAAAEFNGGYIYTSTDSGATWTQQTSAGSRSWRSITSSSDGSKLAAVESNGGYIYTSTDSGTTWTQQTNAGGRYWMSIASSSDGSKLAAAESGSYIYTSTDGGATWTQQTNSGVKYWARITSSSDGSKLAAIDSNGIYISTDGGVSWTGQNPGSVSNWASITSSSDGNKLAAGNYNNYIYTSTDGGSTWIRQANSGNNSWYSLASSSDGNKLAAVNDNIYTSTDGGVNWTQHSNVGGRIWYSIAGSSDGSKLAAVVQGGYIYTSTNGGATWTQQTNSGSRDWDSITSSSDGSKLAAAANDDYIYTSTDGGVTWTARNSAGKSNWRYITSSSDGNKLFTYSASYFYSISTDGGATWTQQSAGNWNGITASSDGSKLAATAYSGIYISTDGGITWTMHNPLGVYSWSRITSSSDGNKLAAGTYGGYIYTSTDGGATWTQQTNSGSGNWQSIACSSDGSKLVAASNLSYSNTPGYIYTSTDGGATWAEQTNAGFRKWFSITVSAAGNKIAACDYGGEIVLGDSGSLPPVSTRLINHNGSSIQLINQNTLGNPLSIFEINETSLNIGTIPDSTFDNVALMTGITGPRLSIPNINPIAVTINAAAGAVSAKVTFYNVDKAAIFMNGKQITDRKGNIFPGYNGYIRDVSWNATTGTLTFEITHFTEYGVPVLEGKPFAGSGAELNIVAQGTNIIAEVPGNSFAGTSLQNTTTTVAKISGLAYETVLSDIPSTINNLYKPLTPGTEYGISFEYINRGNATDTANISLVLTTANVGHYGYSITTDTQAVAPWQVLLFDVKVNANNANAFERATLDATVALPEVSAVSYNAFANAYLGGSFGEDGAYGGVENLSHTFILEAEGYNVAVLSRTATINVPAGYTGSSEDMVPGSKVIYSIAIKNNSTAIATSVNVADQIANNCHLYYTDTPAVEGATAWEWKGVTNNNATSADTNAVKFEITIPASSIVTASYTVTLD